MIDGPMNTYTPDEALYAFMDGELEIHDEQRLFDELAANPELRTEMKDVISIRSAVHRDQLFPSSSVESGILAATGFAPLATAGAVSGAAAGAIAAAPWWEGLSSLFYTAGGIVAGALVVFASLSSPKQEETRGFASGGTIEPPTMQQQGITGAPQQQLPPVVRVDTVYVRRGIVTLEDAPKEVPSNIVESTPIVAPEQSPTTETPSITSADGIDPLSAFRSNVSTETYGEAPYGSAASQGLLAADRVSPRSNTLPAVLGFRTLASGLSASEQTPESVQSANIPPNTAISFTVPLNDDHRIGVEMGTESFRQNFSGFDGYRMAEWTQTPVLFWLGATYLFTPTQFEILPGLSPFGQVTVGGAFSQGPVARGTVGLAYQPVGPLRFTVGLDGSALFYTFQNSWNTSTKWGLSYGLSIDLGAWR